MTWSQYFSSFVKLMWEDKTEFNPGVLTSYGYPLYYPGGAATTWTITVAETQFLHLLFSNISLTKYQVKKNLQYHHIINLSFFFNIIWASVRENLSSVVCGQIRHRPPCAFAQTGQCLCYWLFGKYHI